MAYLQLSLFAAIGLIVLKCVQLIFRDIRLNRIMPPSPPGLPLLGNIFQVPPHQWFQLVKWKEQYGTIFSLNLAGQRVVVLNDFASAAELIDRRSSIYSDRPRHIMGGQILTRGLALPFSHYGDRWRRMRKACHEAFGENACKDFIPMLEGRTAVLMYDMLQDSEHWERNVRRFAASSVLGAVYGRPPIDETSDKMVKSINGFVAQISMALLPGKYLVDFFPPMLYLPKALAKWKREGDEWFHRGSSMFEGFYDDVQTRMRENTSDPCFAQSLSEKGQKYNLSKSESAWLAGFMFAGGADTSAATLYVLFLAMVHYPEVLRRAQAQLDAVVGRERVPNFDDRQSLPYIEAVAKEILRWRPVTPIGGPRRNTEDDWYQGYFIPKGTIVVYNVWAMNRDPKYFPDYEEFRPERYLDDSGQLNDLVPDTHHQGHLSFGCGRRVCPGKDLAVRTLFIDVASMLWGFNIEMAVDADGKPIVPSRTEVVDEGVVAHPPAFKCKITPRFPEAKGLINAAVRAAAGGDPEMWRDRI